MLFRSRSREESAGASWLNLACGPCRELLHLPAAKAERRIVCVDSDSNALDYARRLLDDKPAGACQFVEENAYRFSNAKRTIDRYGQFSTIYSAGLFDYIPSDKLAQLLRGLHDSLAPGGLLLAPFKDQDRYETFDYHWFLKWHYFFQRSESEFWDVFAQAGIPKGAIKVERDATGVLLFFSVRKPF